MRVEYCDLSFVLKTCQNVSFSSDNPSNVVFLIVKFFETAIGEYS